MPGSLNVPSYYWRRGRLGSVNQCTRLSGKNFMRAQSESVRRSLTLPLLQDAHQWNICPRISSQMGNQNQPSCKAPVKAGFEHGLNLGLREMESSSLSTELNGQGSQGKGHWTYPPCHCAGVWNERMTGSHPQPTHPTPPPAPPGGWPCHEELTTHEHHT